MAIPNEWDEMLKKAEEACRPYILYADMFRAGIRTAEKLGVGTSMALKAVSEVVLPEMRQNLSRQKTRIEYADRTSSYEQENYYRLQDCIEKVEQLARA